MCLGRRYTHRSAQEISVCSAIASLAHDVQQLSEICKAEKAEAVVRHLFDMTLEQDRSDFQMVAAAATILDGVAVLYLRLALTFACISAAQASCRGEIVLSKDTHISEVSIRLVVLAMLLVFCRDIGDNAWIYNKDCSDLSRIGGFPADIAPWRSSRAARCGRDAARMSPWAVAGHYTARRFKMAFRSCALERKIIVRERTCTLACICM